jgi:hypothetical protein
VLRVQGGQDISRMISLIVKRRVAKKRCKCLSTTFLIIATTYLD